MQEAVQHWFVRREVEVLSELSAEIAARMENAIRGGRDEEATELVRPLVGVAARLSATLWPIGWSVDPESAAAAEMLRRKLNLRPDHPIAPARIVSYTAIAPLSASELRRVVNVRERRIALERRSYPIQPLLDALLSLHDAVRPAISAA